jgi:hypothetical protein
MFDHQILWLLNFKAKSIFQKEDGIYKIVDDFRKLRVFEVDCAVSVNHFKSTLGNVRQNWVGNERVTRALNGLLIKDSEITEGFLKSSMDFSPLTIPLEQPIMALESDDSQGKSYDTCELAVCGNRELVTCEDYPRELQVHDFGLFNSLRYSCGWKLSGQPTGSTITYVYDMLDVHMIYELVLYEKPAEDKEGQLEGIYTATIMMPSQIKDIKRQIYDTVRREARVWDDIFHLCHLIIAQFRTEWLKEYLIRHRSLVVSEFVHYLNDQKSVKLFERRSFAVLRCDTQIIGDQADLFVRQVRPCFAPTFELGLTNTAIVGLLDGNLVAAVLNQKSRNLMVCTVHILGQDNAQLEPLCRSIQTKIRETGLKVCRSGIERFFSPTSQPMFKCPFYWEVQTWLYSKEIPPGLFNKSISKAILKEILNLDFVMVTGMKKPGQSTGNKLNVFFLKEKEVEIKGQISHYYLLIEASFVREEGGRQHSKDGQPLEGIRIGVLTSDLAIAFDRSNEFKEEDISTVSKSLDYSVDKYSEILYLYHLNIDSVKNYLDQCTASKIKSVNFKLRVPFQVFQQKLKKFEKTKSDEEMVFDIPEFQRYLNDLYPSKEKKKTGEKKNVRVDLLAMSHPVYSYKLDFVFESTIKQDFLMAYEAILAEFCDCSFKIKAPTIQEKNTHFYSKFLKEHLLAIMFIDRSSPESDYMLRVYLLCLKCVSTGTPYSQCEYLNHKTIWINKMYSQVQVLMQKYFLCNLSMKLQNNFRFYGNDIDQLTSYCDRMNIDIDVSSLYRKLRAFFRADGKLSRKFMMRMNKIFRSVLKIFLTKVNHSTSWYFIYKHPEGDSCHVDPEFAMRDKTLKHLMMATSLNSSFGWSDNSFLLMRLGYTNTNRCRFHCEDKQFLQKIIQQCYLDAHSVDKKRERVCSRLLLMNYTPLGTKDAFQANQARNELEDVTPYIKEVLEFEENCQHTFNLIKQAMSKTNIISIVRSFFNFLCLEVQMMDPEQPQEKISEMIRIDLQHFNEEERVSINLPLFGPKSVMADTLAQTLIDKGYFKQVSTQSKKETKARESLYCTFTYSDIESEMSRLKPFNLKVIPHSKLL